MKRRTFLGGGAATALSWAAPSASWASPTDVSAATPRTSWQLMGPHCRYVFRLQGPAFTCDCYPRGAENFVAGEAISPASGDIGTVAEGVLLLAGSQSQPVEWRVGNWRQPNEWTLHLSLVAVALPLEADLIFAIDVATGFLR